VKTFLNIDLGNGIFGHDSKSTGNKNKKANSSCIKTETFYTPKNRVKRRFMTAHL
jgi:hypothetical protein